jgi:hypothetical protein
LLVALAFAVLVNGLVTITLIWPEVAPAPLRNTGLVVAGLWWLAAGILAWRELPELLAATDDDPQKGLFTAAQAEYLKGNWLEAESALRRLLRQCPRDAEGQLLWATLLRRTARLDKARQALQDLSRLDAAAHWQHEIRVERELLRRQAEEERLSQAATSEIAATDGAADAASRAA